jgi:hypothetical protein
MTQVQSRNEGSSVNFLKRNEVSKMVGEEINVYINIGRLKGIM